MSKSFDPDYGSALEAAAAIRNKEISSVELTRHTLKRIEALDPALNSCVYQLREQALADALKADEALVRKRRATGLFHGVPVNVKESFGVAGQPCTWGFPFLKEARAAADAHCRQPFARHWRDFAGRHQCP